MRFYTLLFVIAFMLTSYTAAAVTFTPETRRSFEGEPFAVKFKLSKDTIASGEPVLLNFEFTNTRDKDCDVTIWDFFDYNDPRFNNEEGAFYVFAKNVKTGEIYKRNYSAFEIPGTISPVCDFFPIPPKGSNHFSFPLSQRVLTTLPAGRYEIYVKNVTFAVSWEGEKKQVDYLWEGKVTLNVSPYNDVAVDKAYSDYLERAIKEPIDKNDPRGLFRASKSYAMASPYLRAIIWADSKYSLPYKTKLLEHASKYSDFFMIAPTFYILLCTLVQAPDTAVAEAFIRILAFEEVKELYERRLGGITWTVWAANEVLKKCEDEKTRTRLQEALKDYPTFEDPRKSVKDWGNRNLY